MRYARIFVSLLTAGALAVSLAACGPAASTASGAAQSAASSASAASGAASPAASGAPDSAASAVSSPASTSAAASTAASDSRPTTAVTLTPPEGFTALELADYDQAWQAADGSSILVYTIGTTIGFDSIDRATLEEQLASQYATYSDVTVTGYADSDIAGCPARRLDLTATWEGGFIRQTMLLLKSDNALCVVFTDLSGNNSYTQAFADCIASLQVNGF